MKWGPEADAKLFAAVIKAHSIKLDYAALSAEMGLMGEACTPKAIIHRIAKIKADAASRSGNNNSNGSTARPAAAPVTPVKRSRAPNGTTATRTPGTQKKSWSAAKRRKLAATNNDNDGHNRGAVEKTDSETELKAGTAANMSPTLRAGRVYGNDGADGGGEEEDDDEEEEEQVLRAKRERSVTVKMESGMVDGDEDEEMWGFGDQQADVDRQLLGEFA